MIRPERSSPTPVVELHAVEKAYRPGHKVLSDVDFDVRRGEVHALVGENGAGKSTLMGILVGMVQPDAGSLRVAGEAVTWRHWSPRAARSAGIAMVYQHSTLVPALTVAENVAFSEPGLAFEPSAAEAQVGELSRRYGLAVPARARVEDLSVGEQQRAELLRALARKARLLILDEPTAILTPGEVDALIPILQTLRREGRGVVFISHKLDEIREIANRVTILRRGERVATLADGHVDARELGRLMLGENPTPLVHERSEEGACITRLSLRHLHAPGLRERSRLRDLDLDVRGGEIVGVAGVDGNGQRELEEVFAGLRPLDSGWLEVAGRRVAPGVRSLRRAGVAQLSGDRTRAGLVPGLSIAENLVVKGSYDDVRFFSRFWIDRYAVRRHAREAIVRFDVRPADGETPVEDLSGGNAQKVAVAREFESAREALVAFHPTRGLDVSSARFVQAELLELRRRGVAVLLISSDLDEIESLSDRVVALVEGRFVPVPEGADRATLGSLLLGERASCGG